MIPKLIRCNLSSGRGIHKRAAWALFSLQIHELILYYINSIFSRFSLKIQALILFYIPRTREHTSLFSLKAKYGLPRLPSPSDTETQQSVCQKRKPGAPDSSFLPYQSNSFPIERDGEIRMGAESVCEGACPHRRDVTVMRAETNVVLCVYVVWSTWNGTTALKGTGMKFNAIS